jgi:hypothetical protein
VYVNGVSDDFEGQVTVRGGHVIYSQFEMPDAHSFDELAQEIAGTVDNMETKTCTISNFASHGTGGGRTDSVFDCGSKRFNAETLQVQHFKGAWRVGCAPVEMIWRGRIGGWMYYFGQLPRRGIVGAFVRLRRMCTEKP